MELGEQVLLLRHVVDDGDAPQRGGSALQRPFAAELSDDMGGEGTERGRCLAAASGVRSGKRRVQEGAASVSVDLDQLRALATEMEVVAHEDAARGEVGVGDSRRALRDLIPVRRQGRHGFDRRDGGLHGCHVAAGNEH